LLLSIPGIGEISALNLLGELALLAPGLTVRQWVFAGATAAGFLVGSLHATTQGEQAVMAPITAMFDAMVLVK